ncbi:MAG: tRNA (guanine-N1)-methyltransferase [Vulcanisaeta sp.]|jgi:tRNA (adenine9-N1/guanine9-N1)-methyltransferase|nr:tRNA (guanine-N1)-methyltransferase [Vulcanisaeta sp.]
MLLGRLLLEELRKLGIRRLCIGKLRCRDYLPQCIAVSILLGRYVMCSGGYGRNTLFKDNDLEIMSLGKDGAPCDAMLAKPAKCPSPIKVEIAIPNKPRFIIDLALWRDHTKTEKNELVEQVLTSIITIRKYLWDGNLELSDVPDEFLEYLGKFARGFVNAVIINRGPPRIENPAVMLDPEGDCALNEELIRGFSTFVIGGIVDKERRVKGETKRLYDVLSLNIPRCRIELRGSVVGVPDRINKIIEIILRVLFEGRNIEEAIIMSMSKRDRINRLFYEFQKAAYRVRINNITVLALSKSIIEKVNWLNATPKEVEIALRKSHVVLMSDDELGRYLSLGLARPGPYTHRYVK